MLQRWFPARPAIAAGRSLFKSVSAQARNPVLYLAGQAPDTREGRFELVAMHLVLVMRRLKGEGAQASEVSQALFDAFLSNLDEGLRDMGVGDLSVGKKMRKLGEAIYGRVKGYDAALQHLPDRTPLAALIGRTLFGVDEATPALALADYAARAAESLGGQSLEQIIAAELAWPEFAHVG